MSEFTHILERVERGEPKAAAELLPIVYEELRRLAAQKMANEAAGHTLQPTALVHEAWLRLGGSHAPSFQNRAHFFGAAAEAMRRILIERARRRIAAKRGAGAAILDLDEIEIPSPVADDDQLVAVNDSLEKFATLDPRNGTIVNGAKLTNQQSQLKYGQTVRFGSVEARLELDGLGAAVDDTSSEMTAVHAMGRIMREQQKEREKPQPANATMKLESPGSSHNEDHAPLT